MLLKLGCSQVISWQQWSISGDCCSAACKGKWLCSCIWVVNDTFMSCSVYYIAWTYSGGRKQKQGNDPKCSSKQKFLLLLQRFTNYVRKSCNCTVLSGKTWWVGLNSSLPVKVFNEFVPTGTVGTTGGFHTPVTGWLFSAFLIWSC